MEASPHAHVVEELLAILGAQELTRARNDHPHLVLAVAFAVFFYWFTGGWAWPILAIIGGILIDIDHFIDYFRHFGPRFSLIDFFGHRYRASGKCYILFHSWEIILILWVFSAVFVWITPLVAGMTVHMETDLLSSHRKNPRILFLSYRLSRDFKLPED